MHQVRGPAGQASGQAARPPPQRRSAPRAAAQLAMRPLAGAAHCGLRCARPLPKTCSKNDTLGGGKEKECKADSFNAIVKTSGTSRLYGYLQLTANRTDLTVTAMRVNWVCTDGESACFAGAAPAAACCKPLRCWGARCAAASRLQAGGAVRAPTTVPPAALPMQTPTSTRAPGSGAGHWQCRTTAL